MAKRKIPKRTPEQRAKWQENQRRLELIIERRLKEDAARTRAKAADAD